jgi:hypothetical protein
MSVRIIRGVRFAAAFVGVVLFGVLATGHRAYSLDASLPAYRAVETLSGHLKSVGSDTLGQKPKLGPGHLRKSIRT